MVIVAERLDDGVAFVEDRFGVRMAPGGAHAAMGTHNRLLSLGPGLYLEVIAIDPAARAPGRARWFDMDRLSGPPRLTNWVVRCDDMDEALADLPMEGSVMELSRGDLSWQMAVPDDGVTPFAGLAPGLIRWHGTAHPAARLPDAGCRLRALTVALPDAGGLRAALGDLDGPVAISSVDPSGLTAVFDTPRGRVTLG
nr:VOC family protein [Oceaniglobus trochenteri]